jgi:hypothetical protein
MPSVSQGNSLSTTALNTGRSQQQPTEIRESMQNQHKTKDLMEKSENIQNPNSMENPTHPMENQKFSKTRWKTH